MIAAAWLAALLLCALGQAPPAGAVTAKLHRVAHLDAGAVCNDGSSGAYYLQQATTAPDKWVIRLMGGGWCISASDCEQRWQHAPYFMSTSQLPDSLSPGEPVPGVPDVLLPLRGILSPDAAENPHWAGWSHAYVWYCSSDSHLGRAPKGSVPGRERWAFAGKRIVRVAVADMLAAHSLANATHVLLTGDSAGGVGALHNAAFVRDLLQAAPAPGLAAFKVLVDAGWFLDIPSFSPTGWFTFQAAARQLQTAYNASFDRACEAHWGPVERWRCFHAQYAWPHVPVEAFYLEFLYDSANWNFDSGGDGDREALRRPLAAALAAIPPAAPSALVAGLLLRAARALGLRRAPAAAVPLPSVFAPACFLHETLDSRDFAGLRAGAALAHPRLLAWFERGERSRLLDAHAGPRPPAECLAPLALALRA